MTWRQSHLAVDVLPDVLWIVVDFKDLLFQLFYVILFVCILCLYACMVVLLPILARTLLKKIFLISMSLFPVK